MKQLNPKQREAVLHAHGPLLILAGAGSGKTNTMAHRIAHLISALHLPPSAILGLSFTRKAAIELKERVTKLVSASSGKSAVRGLTITTFHSLCARILRQDAAHLGFQQNFTILDQNDQRDLLRQVLRNIKIDERRFDPDTILFEIGQAKNRFLDADAAEEFFLGSKRISEDYAIAAASSYRHYQSQLKLLNAMDFDDLLYQAVRLLEGHPDVRERYNLRFRHILVDEYQDTNPAQFKLLRLLTEKQQNLCVVGDDDQSIYGWRGADSRHILEFAHQFPEAKTITLEQNYRSSSTILDAANEVIAKNTHRHPKKLWSDRGTGEPIHEFVLEEDRDEAEFVAEELSRRNEGLKRPWKDFAILYRSNAQSRVFEEALRRHKIPYKIVGGMSFLDRKEVKDVLSYWRLVSNWKDDASLRRIINWPARGIGKGTIEAIGTYAFENQKSLFEALQHGSTTLPRAREGLQSLASLILDLRKRLEISPLNAAGLANWGRQSLELIGAKRAILEETDDPVQAARRWENVEELVHSLGQMELAGDESDSGEQGSLAWLREFLARMTLEAQDREEDEEKNAFERDQVTLLTLHGAKGLEFPIVFLVGMEEGFLPHKRTLEEVTDLGEERRLCYVGITRAKDHLILTRAKNRIRYGKPVPRSPSRFLADIPEQLMIRKDESQSGEAHEAKVKNHLAKLREQILKGKV